MFASEGTTVEAKKGWLIGELSRRVGIPAQTLRYYERLGLIDPRSEQSPDIEFIHQCMKSDCGLSRRQNVSDCPLRKSNS